MKRRLFILVVTMLAVSIISASYSYAAQKESFGTKVKNFWKNLLGYPARVTEESASVVADTTKKGASVVANEIKRVSEVTTGDVAKTKELITEPITGTAETVVKAGEGIVSIPSEAAKEKVTCDGPEAAKEKTEALPKKETM